MLREDILARLRERIIAFAASRYGRDVAEDMAQETLILLHEKYPHVERAEELLPLSLQIVRYKIAGIRRTAQRRGEDKRLEITQIQVADPAPGPAAYAERQERLERLAVALGELGERCRELFRLKLEGFNFPEIQKRMGAASLNTIYTWDLRCRQQLRKRLGKEWSP